MRAKLTRIRLRDLALFVAVAGIVAVAAVFAAREAGLDGPPLTLTLSAPDICETTRGQGADWATQIVDDEGNDLGNERTYVGHFSVAGAPVQWQVIGGVGPYTLEFDGETRDKAHEYAGASGEASVGCATTTVESFFWSAPSEPDVLHRAYRADPEVDSGWKTVRAVVTDANGDTAEATTRFYVILKTDDWRHVLRGGETYRVFGHLMTVPEGINLEIGDHSSGSVSAQSFVIAGTRAVIWLSTDAFEEVGRWLPEEGVQGTAEGVDLDTKLDELADSIGQLPKLNRGGQ